MSLNPFTQIYKFIKKQKELKFFQHASPEAIFTNIYHTNKWGDKDTRSGKGSTLDYTQRMRTELPDLLRELHTKVLLDIPCGDFHWMQVVELPVQQYIGADIVKPMIAGNSDRYSNDQRQFMTLNLLSDQLPSADTILCRECLVHLSFADINRAIANIKHSGARLLLTTNFPDFTVNEDIVTGKHRRLNFSAAPWHWPPPMRQITEQDASSQRGRKELAVWRISDLP